MSDLFTGFYFNMPLSPNWNKPWFFMGEEPGVGSVGFFAEDFSPHASGTQASLNFHFQSFANLGQICKKKIPQLGGLTLTKGDTCAVV